MRPKPKTLDSAVVSLSDIENTLQSRAEGIDTWLRQIGSSCKAEQKHCEEGTVERTYWHYGYMMALRDALDLIRRESQVPS